MSLLVIISGIITVTAFVLFTQLVINLCAFYRLKATARGSAGGNPGGMPMVSILVPARNEEKHIQECVRSLLQQSYERLEVLVLDDLSTDATAAIVRRVIDELQSGQKGRLQLLRGEPLPQGWVGKNFACYQLAQHARGDYLLFTDADSVHAPETVQAVVDCMRDLDVKLLTGQPGYNLKSLGERLVVPLLTFTVLTLLPVPLVRRSSVPILAAANGALLCFQRTAYEAIDGHRAVKESILEDVLLARAIKGAGYRMAYVDAMELVRCYMYDSFADVWEGLSKNTFAYYNSSLFFSLVFIVFNLAVFVLPPLLVLLSLFIPLPSIVVLFALSSYLLAVLIRVVLTLRFTWFRRALMLLLCLLHPLSVILECLILLNSIWWRYRKAGTVWKGRHYTY